MHTVNSTLFISMLLSAAPDRSAEKGPSLTDRRSIEAVAPYGTIAVIADFSFGQRRLCRYDRVRDRWACRFDIPNAVAGGRYPVRVLYVLRGGRRSEQVLEYLADNAGRSQAWLLIQR